MDSLVSLFEKGRELSHTWLLTLDLAGNMDEINLSFLSLSLEGVLRWFLEVGDEQDLGLVGRVRMISDAHGEFVVD